MPKAPYLPWDDQGKADWLDNFNTKLPTYAGALVITPAELASVAADDAMFNYLVDMQEAFKTFKQDLSNYKNLLRDGGTGPTGPLPVAPVLPAPAPVQKGIFRRIRELVGRIKSTPGYTEAIGEDLGIVGDEQTVDLPTLKPVLKHRLESEGRPLIIWKKGPADGIDLLVDRGTGAGFVFLARDTEPDYLDTFELPAGTPTAVWTYKAIYFLNDGRVGQFSDPIEVTVTKQPG